MYVKKGEKPHIKEFPPDYEDEEFRVWKNNKDDVKKMDDRFTIAIRDEDEELHQLVVYPMKDYVNGGYLENFDLKVISKINKKTKIITMILKGQTIASQKKEFTKEEYDKLVSDLEKAPMFDFIYHLEGKRVYTAKDIEKRCKKTEGMKK